MYLWCPRDSPLAAYADHKPIESGPNVGLVASAQSWVTAAHSEALAESKLSVGVYEVLRKSNPP